MFIKLTSIDDVCEAIHITPQSINSVTRYGKDGSRSFTRVVTSSAYFEVEETAEQVMEMAEEALIDLLIGVSKLAAGVRSDTKDRSAVSLVRMGVDGAKGRLDD